MGKKERETNLIIIMAFLIGTLFGMLPQIVILNQGIFYNDIPLHVFVAVALFIVVIAFLINLTRKK